MRQISLFAVFFALIASSQACTTKRVVKQDPAVETPAAEQEEETTPAEEEPAKPKGEMFGAKINPETPATALEEIMKTPEGFAGKNLMTEGTVRQVCQKRGCWAEVRPNEARDSDATMTVRFKGYSFFLPKDSRGAKVKLEGELNIQALTAEEVKHYEEEGATFPDKKADGTASVTQFIASGVEMTGRKK